MAANIDRESAKRGRQANNRGTIIPEHFPFVHVASSVLESPPLPDEKAGDPSGSDFIYFFKDARVVIDPQPGTRIKYCIVPEKPLAERPGSDDVAPPDDIRWLADIRDVLSYPAPLKKTANPLGPIGDEVAAVVNLVGGELKANFPCDSVQPRAFIDADGKRVPGLRRVLASEFMIDIPYPKETERVTLSFDQLRKGTSVTGPPKLVLKWPEKETTLEVRMGNDTKEEIRRLNTRDNCDPSRQTGPVLKLRDDEFDLHYNLVDIQGDVRPLPQNDIQQCGVEHCKPMMLGGLKNE
jgi:hypothetical protein